MVAFQPYKGGNDLLWAMNKICNSHKHETIVRTALHVGGMSVRYFSGNVSEASFPPKWDSVKNEMVLWYALPGQKVNYNFKIEIFIEMGVINKNPAVSRDFY